LKENVIIGKLIPAGTGLSRYHDIIVTSVSEQEAVAKKTPEIEEAVMTAVAPLDEAMSSLDKALSQENFLLDDEE